MPEAFDPYYQWLGIPPEEQPPDHYRLLGAERLESHPEVIRAAADRQTVHLRTFIKGPRADTVRRLLDEVAAARACLLDPIQKAAYDRQWQPPADTTTPLDDLLAQPAEGEPTVLPRLQRPRRSWWPQAKKAIWIGALVVVVTVVAAGVRVGLQRLGKMIERAPKRTEQPSPEPPREAQEKRLAAIVRGEEAPLPLGQEDRAEGALVRTLPGHRRPVSAIVFTRDGHRLISGAKDTRVRWWDVASGVLCQTRDDHQGEVNTLALSPNGARLATGSDDATVRLFDAASGQPRQTLHGHTGPVRAVAFSPDGTRLASAGHDDTIRLWDPAAGSPEGQWAADGVMALAFSPDGTLLASGGLDGVIRLWQVKTHQLLGTLEGHAGPVRSLAFHPNGSLLASGSEDRTAILWDVAGQTVRHKLTGHADRVLAVVFSPDGATLASGGYDADRSIRLWDVATGRLIRTLPERAALAWLAFSPDGRLLAAAAYDGRVRLWDVRPKRVEKP